MRKLFSISVAVLLAFPLAACDEQPTELSQETQVAPETEVSASHGSSDEVTATAVYQAVGTEAAALNDFDRGERVGTLTVVDDGSELEVTGQASGLDEGAVYVSLFYDKRSSVQGSPASGNAAVNASACEPGVEPADHPLHISGAQMEIGPGDSPGPLAWWDVSEDGTATLGPTSTHEYVPVKKIGTVSIRDARIADADVDGDGNLDPGAGPEAVVACGVVTHDPAN